MRCFISIELPENVLSKLGRFNRKLKENEVIAGNFVAEKNTHLTLKFLGEISEKQVYKIKEILEQIKFKEFEISLKGLGVFPSRNFVRVLWVGVEKGNAEIVKLQKELDEKLAKIGFQKEKSFVPHLTIARVKFVRDKEKLLALLESREKFGDFWCSNLNLMKSELTSSGLVYSEL